MKRRIVITVAIMVAVVALIPLLMPAIGLGGIALAAAIAKAAKVLALLLFFERKVTTFRLASLGPFALPMAVASLVIWS